jgi:hypothetical protein
LWTNRWPSTELHVLLYGLEGMLILAGKRDGHGLRLVERSFARLMEETQAPDSTLPETIGGGIVHSDVLAQALRVGLLLRGCGFLRESVWGDRLDRLADAIDTAHTSVMVAALAVRGPASKIDRAPNISDGRMTASTLIRPSGERWLSFTFPETMM